MWGAAPARLPPARRRYTGGAVVAALGMRPLMDCFGGGDTMRRHRSRLDLVHSVIARCACGVCADATRARVAAGAAVAAAAAPQAFWVVWDCCVEVFKKGEVRTGARSVNLMLKLNVQPQLRLKWRALAPSDNRSSGARQRINTCPRSDCTRRMLAPQPLILFIVCAALRPCWWPRRT
jgi:hypothetical protein